MSEKMEAVATSEAPAALGAYSQAVKANGFVFVSGQLGIDPATGELAGETAGEQAAQALKNIKHILDTAGTGIEHVCRATIYLKNVEDFKEVDARYAEAFIGSVKPARVAFGNNMIPKGALVEIDAIAVDLPVANYYVRSYSDCQVIKEIPTGEQYAVTVSKENPELTKALNKALQAVHDNGKYDELAAKWLQ